MSADRVMFPYGNTIPFWQDFGPRLGVPGGIIFDVRRTDRDCWLTAPGFGLHERTESGRSLYGSGAICAASSDVDAAIEAWKASGAYVDER